MGKLPYIQGRVQHQVYGQILLLMPKILCDPTHQISRRMVELRTSGRSAACPSTEVISTAMHRALFQVVWGVEFLGQRWEHSPLPTLRSMEVSFVSASPGQHAESSHHNLDGTFIFGPSGLLCSTLGSNYRLVRHLLPWVPKSGSASIP